MIIENKELKAFAALTEEEQEYILKAKGGTIDHGREEVAEVVGWQFGRFSRRQAPSEPRRARRIKRPDSKSAK